MTLFGDVEIDIGEVGGAMQVEWDRLGRAGACWTGAERVAIATEVRAARTCPICAPAGNLPQDRSHAGSGPLGPAIVDVIHLTVSDPGACSAAWYDDVRMVGLPDERFVELIGAVATTVMVDTVALAIGAVPPPLPTPQPGRPTHAISADVEVHSAWVPTVPPERAEGDLAALYNVCKSAFGFVPNAFRALTLVPDEQLGFASFAGPAYLGGRVIDVPQRELLASTVSSHNDCFYCMAAHALLLDSSESGANLEAACSLEDQTDAGVIHGADLRRFALSLSRAVRGKADELPKHRDALQRLMGQKGVVEAAAIVAFFDAINRICDATGTVLDDGFRKHAALASAYLRAKGVDLTGKGDYTHKHVALSHGHRHYHVLHNWNENVGGFDHVNFEHDHDHDHAALTHAHNPHENYEDEHRIEAHVHDHAERLSD